MNSMKTILLCFILINFIACNNCLTRQDSNSVDKARDESSIRIDVLDDSQFISFTPVECQVEYAVEFPPSTTDSTILFCAAASFTGQRMNEFKYSNICGPYIVDSIAYNRLFNPTTNIDASFAYWNGKAYFAKGKSQELLDSASQNKGVFFMQKQVLCDGERGEMNLTRNTIYRVLAEYDDKLCIIQNTQPMVYTTFVDGLEKLGVKNAIYLDMGGWSYSWYRNSEGELIELFPKSNDTKFQTNWLVFRK